ncbi:MAG: serine hydrolase [Enterococcus sp.]
MKKGKIILLSLLVSTLFVTQVIAQTESSNEQKNSLTAEQISQESVDSSTEEISDSTYDSYSEKTSFSYDESPSEQEQEVKQNDSTTETSYSETMPSYDWIERTEYLTITDTKELYSDPEMNKPANGINKGITVKIIRSKETESGELFELKLNGGKLVYGRPNAGTIAKDAFGIPTTKSGYLIITNDKAAILQNDDGSETLPAANYLKTTLTVKAVSQHFNGIAYYQVADSKGQILGWLPQKDGKITAAQGDYRNYGRYLNLKGNQTVIWTSFAFTSKRDNRSFLNRTLLAKGIYYHANGKNYLSIYEHKNNKDVWVGYIEETMITYAGGPQGNYQNYNRYATISRNDYTIWNSFSWNPRRTSKSVFGKTYLAKGRYIHYNGSTYLSLYDSKNNWIGYINSTGTKITDKQQGIWQNFNKYITVTTKNYTVWDSFAWKKKQGSSALYGKTYHAQGQYRHYNGETYYSLYDNKNKWQGYINSTGVKVASGKQGIWQKGGQKVILTKQNWDLWSSFNWTPKAKSNSYRSKLFTAQGYYQHFNGSRYLSLYDGNGKWYGYINSSATKVEVSTRSKIKRVQDLLNRKYKSGNYGIYVTSLIDGETAQINGSKTFMGASTGKLPVLYYTQKMINEKKLNPNKLYTYTDQINRMTYSYMRGGAGILQTKKIGNKYSLYTIMDWTCKYSDNQGANFLGYYGANKYDQKMRNEISRVIGRRWDGIRYVTARENSLLLKEMYHNGGNVLNYMSNTTYDKQRLPKYLPVRVAHKIGDLYGYAHDCGIIYTNKPYIISVMTNNSNYETISKLSKEVYDFMR